jgi:hypothetical protein
LIGRYVLHILAVMILACIVVDLVQRTVERGRGMTIPASADLSDHFSEPFVRLETRRIGRAAIGFENHPHLSHHIDQRAGAVGDVGLQIVDVGRGPPLGCAIEAQF